ncbi:MAG TPA: alpha/beta fold hydrolase [Candidatus Obscuribacterales bacterium]
MKARTLAACLVVSLLLNAAGVVFFFLYLNERGERKSAAKERSRMAQRLTALRAAELTGEQSRERIERHTFRSHVDGTQDEFALIEPSAGADVSDLTLVVYLHGMGSTYLEPFFVPPRETVADAVTRTHPSTVFLSPSYRREASWGNDAAVCDITQNIRQVCQQFPIKRIVIMGTSMGGCVGLVYAESAPADVKQKIAGVVSVESAGDLVDLYKTSMHPGLAMAMISAFGGSPEQVPQVYKKKSFLKNLDGLPAGVRIAIISAREDEIVPPRLQHDIVKALERHHVPVKLIEVDGEHGPPPVRVYMEAFDFVLPKRT